MQILSSLEQTVLFLSVSIVSEMTVLIGATGRTGTEQGASWKISLELTPA